MGTFQLLNISFQPLPPSNAIFKAFSKIHLLFGLQGDFDPAMCLPTANACYYSHEVLGHLRGVLFWDRCFTPRYDTVDLHNYGF